MTPTRAPRPCPGCRRRLITEAPLCQACLQRRRAREDAGRPSGGRRYGTKQHRRWRTMVLDRDPVCMSCGRAPATVADHVNPLPPLGTGDYSLGNGQGLCGPCHGSKTARDRPRNADGSWQA